MDAETKHTKGPWFVDVNHEGRPTVMEVGGLQRHIVIASNGGVPEEQEAANLALIAAAPEMLEALRGLLKETGFWGVGPDDSEILYCEHCEASHRAWDEIPHADACPITKARAAIAKAEARHD